MTGRLKCGVIGPDDPSASKRAAAGNSAAEGVVTWGSRSICWLTDNGVPGLRVANHCRMAAHWRLESTLRSSDVEDVVSGHLEIKLHANQPSMAE